MEVKVVQLIVSRVVIFLIPERIVLFSIAWEFHVRTLAYSDDSEEEREHAEISRLVSQEKIAKKIVAHRAS
eukprot:COSAG05_NODE_3660_length_1922_cov_43.870543_2_plen_71_part_00